MAILKYANQSGVVYAYESVSEWDPVKKQSRSKRKCLGRVDPDTGEIIPTKGRRGRPPKNENSKKHPQTHCGDQGSELAALKSRLSEMEAGYDELLKQIQFLLDENKKMRSLLLRFRKDASEILDIEK